MTYDVTPQELINARNDTDKTAAEIKTILTQIRAYVVNLEASWHREIRSALGSGAR